MYMGFVGGALDQQAVMAAPGLDLQVVGVFRYREQDPTSFRGNPTCCYLSARSGGPVCSK